MASTAIALRRSLIAKVALFLSADERDMSLYKDIERENNLVVVTHGGVRYGVVARVLGQDLLLDGVNVTFLDEVDASPDRNKNKRYIQPAIIRVCRRLDATARPYIIEEQVVGVIEKLKECFSDGFLEIWDYTDLDSPVFTEVRANWKDTGLAAANESDASEGGDVTYAITIFLEYVNKNYG